MAACWWRTSFPSLALFILTAAFIVTKTGRDALFFEADGIADLPKAYLLLAVLSVPAASGTLGLMRLFGPRRARVLSLLMMAALQVAAAPLVPGGGKWGMTLFFVSIPLLYGVLLSLAWLLGADLLDQAPRSVLARLYSTMGAASMLGAMAGGGAARRLAIYAAPQLFLVAGAIGLILAAAVAFAAHRSFPVAMNAVNDGPAPSTPGGELPAGGSLVELFRRPYTAVLAAIGMISSLVGVMIEFQFYYAAAAEARDGRHALRLFADFYLILNGVAATIQIFVTPGLQRLLGVHRSLLILPGTLVAAASVCAATATALARAGLRVAEGGLKSSVHRSNWEQAFLPLDRASRPAAKLLVDGVAARIGEGLAAGILLAAMGAPNRGTDWMNSVLIGGSAVWLALTAVLIGLRDSPGLLRFAAEELRPDLPIPDG